MPALRHKTPTINLLPSDEADASLKGRVVRWLLGTFRFLVIVVELVVIGGFLSRFFLDSKNSDLTDDINQKKALIESYFPFEKDFKFAQKRLDLFSTYAYSSPLFSSYIDQIVKNVPSDLQVTRITIDKGQLTLNVAGRDERSIAQFAQKLQQEPLLRTIAITGVESLPNSELIQAILRTGDVPIPTPTSNEKPSG